MIWFDIKTLEKELADGNLSDREGFNYLLANVIVFTVVPYLSSSGYTNNWLTYIEIAIDVFITVVLLKATFDINSPGKDYFKRFLALSFVNGVRLVVFALLVALPFAIIILIFKKSTGFSTTIEEILMLCLSIFMSIVYYAMLTSSFRRVNGK